MKKLIVMAALCLAVTSAKAQYKIVNFSNLNTTICAGTITVDVVVQHTFTCATTVVTAGTVPSLATVPFALGGGALLAYPPALYNIIAVQVGTSPLAGVPLTGCGPTGYPNIAPGGAPPCPDVTIWDLSVPPPTAACRYQ
jgi:hypothetical protein